MCDLRSICYASAAMNCVVIFIMASSAWGLSRHIEYTATGENQQMTSINTDRGNILAFSSKSFTHWMPFFHVPRSKRIERKWQNSVINKDHISAWKDLEEGPVSSIPVYHVVVDAEQEVSNLSHFWRSTGFW